MVHSSLFDICIEKIYKEVINLMNDNFWKGYVKGINHFYLFLVQENFIK